MNLIKNTRRKNYIALSQIHDGKRRHCFERESLIEDRKRKHWCSFYLLPPGNWKRNIRLEWDPIWYKRTVAMEW